MTKEWLEKASFIMIIPGVFMFIGNYTKLIINKIIYYNYYIKNFCFFIVAYFVNTCLKIKQGLIVHLNTVIKEILTLIDYSKFRLGRLIIKKMNDSEIWNGNKIKFYNI
jgi:hypothetical protein